MTKFKHKNGGICEVFSRINIEKLRKDPNYKEIKETSKEEQKPKEEQNESKK